MKLTRVTLKIYEFLQKSSWSVLVLNIFRYESDEIFDDSV